MTTRALQAWETIDRARAPDGAELVLARRGGEWVVRAAGRVLMSSGTHASEEALASLALARAPAAPAVLVGGPGLGFTVRAALDAVPADARVTVAVHARLHGEAGLGSLRAAPARFPIGATRARLPR